VSIKPIIQQITAKQQALEKGVAQIQTEKMRGIEAKADDFLTASDPIGFIGKLASESPDEIAPVVNAARRKKKEVMQAQAPQQETVFNAGLREILTPQQPQQPQQPPPNPRQMAVAGLQMRPDMFKAGGGIVAFANGGQPQINTSGISLYPGLPGVKRAQAAENEKRKRIIEAEREANKQGKTLFAPRRSSGFVDFLGGDSPITTPSLPPGQAYTPGIFGLMRGQLANQKAGEATDTPRPQLSQADIQAISSGDKTIEDVDLSRAADIDTLTDAQKDRRFAKSEEDKIKEFYERIGPQGPDPLEIEAEKDAFKTPTITMEDTGLMNKAVDRDDKGPERIQFEFTDMDTLIEQAQQKADSIFKKIEGSDDFANPEQAVAETRAFFEKSGVDLTNAEQRAALDKQEALLAKDKKEGAMYALLEFGFGLMAGKSPNALTNVGEAGKAVAPRLFQLQKDIRKGNERLTDARLKLAELENTQKMGIAKVSMERIEKEKERIAKANDRIAQSKASFVNNLITNRRMLDVSKNQAMVSLRTAEMSRDATLQAAQMKADKINSDQLLADLVRRKYRETDPDKKKQIQDTIDELTTSFAAMRPSFASSFPNVLGNTNTTTADVSRLENQPGMVKINPSGN